MKGRIITFVAIGAVLGGLGYGCSLARFPCISGGNVALFLNGIAQLRALVGRRIQELLVAAHNVLGRADRQLLPTVEQYSPVAEFDHRRARVRDEENRGSACANLFDACKALALKKLVAHR
ncbi:hypothetical protein D3C71_811690 [compost metagenome]